MASLDWSQCPAVESIPGKVSGAWVLKGTRTPVKVLFENLEAGMSIEEVIEQFPVTHHHLAAGPDGSRRQAPRDVPFQGHHDFGLRAVAFDDDRQRFDHAVQRLIHDLLANAARHRLAPHSREPFGKGRSHLVLNGR